MLFNSLEYLTFFVVVFVAYWATVRYAAVALGLLLAASLVFYGSWNPWYLLLIMVTTAVDFVVGHFLYRTRTPLWRKVLLWTSVLYNLGTLATFKYLNFFLTNIDAAARDLAARGWLPPDCVVTWRLDVLLPVGISFFVFQSMSYTIDIYRGELVPVSATPEAPPGISLSKASEDDEDEDDDRWRQPGERWFETGVFAPLGWLTRYGEYLLYVSFFPQLVAGPIVRARDFLPQLRQRPVVTEAMGGRGLFLIGLGLFKKVVIADYLALNLVDRCFEAPAGFSSLEMLAGVYGYALQIYGDFSGYSDVAIGSALLLGFTFPENFNAPYIARNLQDFWRRWHISLSSWLRDYLYVSLGGNRKGPWKTYRNLLLTMVLGGLWHGAGWNFLVWGVLHGGALAVLRYVERQRGGKTLLASDLKGRWLAGVLTFHYVCFAWIFFRCPTFAEAQGVLESLAAGTTHTQNLSPMVLLALGVGLGTHLWPRYGRGGFEWIVARFSAMPSPIQAALLVGAAFGIRALASAEVVPFIYFQF